MPRLPSVESLGGRPVPAAGGGIVSYRAPSSGGAVSQAITNVGMQLAQVGEQIESQRSGARRSAELNDAMGEATLALGELEIKYQRDQDFKTSPQRFADEAELVRQRIEQRITDEGARGAFKNKYTDLVVAKRLNVLTSAVKQEGDYHVSRLDQNLDTYAQAAANAGNPAEVALIEGEAEIAISDLQRSGWIRDIDAGQRRRGFMRKIDEHVVARDMNADPLTTATKLATDPKYAANVDPEKRERMIATGLNRAEQERIRSERESEKARRETADQIDKDMTDAHATGRLTADMVRNARPILSPSAYRHWVEALNSPVGRDDKAAMGDVLTLLHPSGNVPPNDADVRERVFQYMRQGRLSPQTAQTYLNSLRSQERAEGPKSPYEQARYYITDKLSGGIFVDNPRAKVADGIAALDAWVAGKSGKYTPEELLLERDRIIKNVGGAGTLDPQKQRERAANELKENAQKLANGRMSKTDHDRRQRELLQQIEGLNKVIGGGK